MPCDFQPPAPWLKTSIEYHASPLSAGRAGGVRGGDRLPYVGVNYAPLRSLDWQVHQYGRAAKSLGELAVPTHRFRWDEGCEQAGFARGAAYLVRPDGYVALAGTDAARVGAFLRSPC